MWTFLGTTKLIDWLTREGSPTPDAHVLKAPSRDFIMPTYTPPTKRQRRTTVAELDSIVQVLNFSPYKDSMGGSVV